MVVMAKYLKDDNLKVCKGFFLYLFSWLVASQIFTVYD